MIITSFRHGNLIDSSACLGLSFAKTKRLNYILRCTQNTKEGVNVSVIEYFSFGLLIVLVVVTIMLTLVYLFLRLMPVRQVQAEAAPLPQRSPMPAAPPPPPQPYDDSTLLDDPAPAAPAAPQVASYSVIAGLPNGPVNERLPSQSDFGVGRFYNEAANILMGFEESSVSRNHARIRVVNGQYYISDASSSYGTFLRQGGGSFQQLPADQEMPLNNGDVVRFGSQVVVQFALPAASTPPSNAMYGETQL